MLYSYEDRIKLNFDNISELSKPLNLSKDYVTADGVYGIEKSIKDFSNCSSDYHIKAFIEHGINFSQYLECGFRVHESLPSITMSPFRQNFIKSAKNNNGAYAIGPYINYSNGLLSDDQFNAEKEKLGNNLLVFPAHSTLGGTKNFSISDFCQKIKDISSEFDSVTISLYWKDVELGRDKYYKKYGFKVVTAGYMYDPYFLSRLRSIIELSDFTIANEMGTSSIYALSLNKPHVILPMEVEYDLEKTDGKYLSFVAQDSYDKTVESEKSDDIDLFKSHLLNSNGVINNENRNLINYYSGIDCVKSREELKDIILKCENQYSKWRFYLKKPLFLKGYITRMKRVGVNILKDMM